MEETFASFVENRLINFIETSSKSSFSEISIEGPDLKLFIKKTDVNLQFAPVDYDIISQKQNIEISGKVSPMQVSQFEQDQIEEIEQIEEIKSLWVGLFHHGKEVIKVGDKIITGQLLGTVKCMNLLFEVISPVDGTLTEILAKQDEVVEYGKVLFKINKC